MPLPDNCCDCVCKSFCNDTPVVVRLPDGSYDPPKALRPVLRPGPDGTDVPGEEYDWVDPAFARVNTHACAWNLIAGSYARVPPERIELTSQGSALTRTAANYPVQNVDLAITGAAPITFDVRVGCDQAGGNQQCTLRVRFERGATTQPKYQNLYSSWDDAAFESHQFAPSPQTGQLGWPVSATEIRAFFEVIGADGQALESVIMPTATWRGVDWDDLQPWFGGVNATWTWSQSDGWIYPSVEVSSSVGGFGPGESPHFVNHLFARVPASRPARIAVAMPRANGHSVRVRHRQFRIETTKTENGVPLSPVVPPDVSSYCNPSHQDYQQTSRWPWIKGNCTAWRRHGGRVTNAYGAFRECDMQITINPEELAFVTQVYPEATLLAGAYTLGATSESGGALIDNMFWFSDEPGSTVSIPGQNQGTTVTLSRLEFSLAITTATGRPCGDGWLIRAQLYGRAVFEYDGEISLQPHVRFCKTTLSLPVEFLSGQAFNAAAGSLIFAPADFRWSLASGGTPFTVNRIGFFQTENPPYLRMPLSGLTLQLKT